ncbi:MAG TPA: chemotaxis protein CheW [Candidatus Dormibacteraeota bacterium]|nr:chemotaxis protein CheW [Candidatus Dormibacteraeota bacterium]
MTIDPQVLLIERAKKLAMPIDSQSESSTEPMLSFMLGAEQFLAPLDSVREVAAVETVTKIPGLPYFFAGLTTVRGDIIPVIDIRGILGLPERRPDVAGNIMVVEIDGSLAGIWVDEMHGLTAVDTAHLTVDHALASAGFRGRTPDLLTVIDMTALVVAARKNESAHTHPQEA